MRASVEDRGVKGDCTPLMEAASAGHVDIIKLLLANKADVNAQSSSGIFFTFFLILFCEIENRTTYPNHDASECETSNI